MQAHMSVLGFAELVNPAPSASHVTWSVTSPCLLQGNLPQGNPPSFK
jgi:hypothetical protein